MAVKIKIRPSNPGAAFSNVIRGFKASYRSAIKNIEKEALKRVKDNTPIATGKTVEAWRAKSKVDTSTFNSEVLLHNPLPQSFFLDKGARPSPGRYVPVLGRRITTGIHPGMSGTGYIDKTTKEIPPIVKENLERVILQMKRDVSINFV